MLRRCSFLIVLLLVCAPIVAHANEFPRVGGVLIRDKEEVLHNRTLPWLSAADVVMVAPNPGQMSSNYVSHFTAVKQANPDLLLFRYINITELNEAWGGWEGIVDSMYNRFSNPNRGGQNTAGDGWARPASGSTINSWGLNTAVNIMDYVTPYNGNNGSASSDNDLSKPRVGERPVDFMSRQNYYARVQPIESVIDGVYEDVNRRWPKVNADWDNNGGNSGTNQYTHDEAQRKWREALIRGRDNMVGPTFNGQNSPSGRSNGRAWLQNGGYYLVNASSWLLGKEGGDYLDGVAPLPRIPEYEQQSHGGNHEKLLGWETSRGGLWADGTATPFSSATKSLQAALLSFNFSMSHSRTLPELGHPAFVFETFAENLHMARYSLVAGLMSDGIVQILDLRIGARPWMLDEYVGRDYTALSQQGIHNHRKWLGHAIDPAYPNMRTSNGGRVLMREFEHGLAIILAGRSHRDDHMDKTATVNLPSPGNGYQWARIEGRQDSSWNNGNVVGDTIKLGTTAANVNRNAIILRRVAATATTANEAPKAPTLGIN